MENNRKQRWKQRMRTGLLTWMCMGLLTGCGEEKKVDYRIEGVKEETQEETDEGRSGVLQFAEEETWNETWTIDDGENVAEVRIEADIVLPDTEQMSVVEVCVPEFNGEYKKQIVGRIFGGEEVYYHDFEHLPKKELEEMYDMFEEMYLSEPEGTADGIKEEMDKYKDAVGTAKDTYTLAEEYNINEYIGKRDGITFELEFLLHENRAGGADLYNQRINFFAKDFKDICPKEYEDYITYMEHPYAYNGENECKFSEEEAQKIARKFVDDLGLEYPVLTETKPIIWGDEKFSVEDFYEWNVNGYVFHYEYGLDDVSFTGFGEEWEYENIYNSPEDDELKYSMAAEMCVYVTDRGVIHMYADSPVETTGITEKVELLPLDTIKKIMKEQMTNQYENFHFLQMSQTGEFVFNRLELIYFRVRNKENSRKYSYVPAWRLSDQTGIEKYEVRIIRNPVIINAIDGSVIDFYDET